MQEAHRRSVAKGLSWRMFATADTLILAYFFTGSLALAASIGGLEIVTKVGWYYLHERLWIRLHFPQAHPRIAAAFDPHSSTRSLLKAGSWRVVGALDTIVISLVVTGKLATSASIGGTELITKVALYYLHERMWLSIPWGLVQAVRAASHEPTLAETFTAEWHALRLGLRALFFGFLCFAFLILMALVTYLLHP